jgi:Ca2+-binding RTX toxin-like protein
MALPPLPSITQAMVVQQLDSGLHWFGPSISYSFPTTKLGLTGTTELNSFSALNANQQSKAILALSLWDDLISTSFVSGTAGSSNIEFANTRLAGVYAQTYYPTDGTVWFSSAAIGADLVTPVIGNHGFLTYIHEIGHALGLNHMGDYNGAGANTPKSYQDSTVLSVMSYFGPSWGSGATNGEGRVAWADWVGADNKLYEPQTPMLNDVYAIQQIYGADPSTRIGDTVYGFHSTVGAVSGGIYDFTSNLNPIMCIFDSSGIDTLDLSGWNTSSTISLVPGTFSSGNSMTNNISIAYSCVIENAVGGAGNDVLVGNDYGNVLDGGNGDDNLACGAGADTLIGGGGQDVVSYYSSLTGVHVDLSVIGAQTSMGDASGDILLGVENIEGSNPGSDVLIGDTNGNWINGRGGNDYLVGGAGDDTLIGGDGMALNAAQASVYRLYQATLNREPDLAGLKSWETALLGGQSLNQITSGFVNSAEFQTTYGALNNNQFVTLLYNNVLHRAPDANGLAGWVNLLNTGATRSTVVDGFSESVECQNITALDTQAYATNAIADNYLGQVYRLYEATLNRTPDTAGFQSWIGAMQAGQSLAQVTSGFVNSAEFHNIYSTTDNAQFVTLLYNNVLHRAPDPNGLASWVNQLNTGATRSAVVDGFSESVELINASRAALASYVQTDMAPTWSDVLSGGPGNDKLFGGLGADTFQFLLNGGIDHISGFEVWDHVQFAGFGYANATEVLSHMTQVGQDVVFTDQGQIIDFHHTQLAMFNYTTGIFILI